jgi:hypothetical protein
MLYGMIDQVEERTQIPAFYADCLKTASGMVVKNAFFVAENKLGRKD